MPHSRCLDHDAVPIDDARPAVRCRGGNRRRLLDLPHHPRLRRRRTPHVVEAQRSSGRADALAASASPPRGNPETPAPHTMSSMKTGGMRQVTAAPIMLSRLAAASSSHTASSATTPPTGSGRSRCAWGTATDKLSDQASRYASTTRLEGGARSGSQRLTATPPAPPPTPPAGRARTPPASPTRESGHPPRVPAIARCGETAPPPRTAGASRCRAGTS